MGNIIQECREEEAEGLNHRAAIGFWSRSALWQNQAEKS